MKIYTKAGDQGKTSLIGGTRVPKSHIRIESYGTVDELNSFIGLLNDLVDDAKINSDLKEIQDRLFTVGSSLACDPETPKHLPAHRQPMHPARHPMHGHMCLNLQPCLVFMDCVSGTGDALRTFNHS
jgi:hypothetical protein